MNMRRLLLCATYVLIWPLGSQAGGVSEPLRLDEVLRAAQNNADVRMAQQNVIASRADVLSADHAPLPVLSAKAAASDQPVLEGNALGSQRRTDRSLGMDWTWERGGKRELRTRAASTYVRATEADLSSIRLQQQLATKDAFFDLLAAQERLGHVQAMAQSARQLADSSQRRVAAGDLSLQEATRVSIEAQRAEADTQSAELDLRRASLALAQFTGLQLRPQPPQQWQAQADWPQHRARWESDQAMQDWVEGRADVQAAVRRLEAAEALYDSARALKTLDPTVGVSLDAASKVSNRLLELRVQVPLTLNYAYEGEIGRALAQRDQAREQLDKLRLAVELEWHTLRQELLGAEGRLEVYQDKILPDAQRVAQQAELAYVKGAIPLNDLLDARRTYKSAQLEALMARTEFAKAWTAWQLRRPVASTSSSPIDNLKAVQ